MVTIALPSGRSIRQAQFEAVHVGDPDHVAVEAEVFWDSGKKSQALGGFGGWGKTNILASLWGGFGDKKHVVSMYFLDCLSQKRC